MQREVETKAREVSATIKIEDLTEFVGPVSGDVFTAVWKRMIPVAIKENKSDWAGDLMPEMQLFLDLHHPHLVAC